MTGTARLGSDLQGNGVKLVGLAVAMIAAIGALVVDGELELTFFMAAAVVTALACFDAALDRRSSGFWPWLLASVGILAKAIPSVLARLGDGDVSAAERLDHLGAVLIGVCCAGAALALVRPPRGSHQRNRMTAVVALGGLGSAVAGLSTAFGGIGAFSSRRSAWVFEGLGWGVTGLILGGVVVAVSTARVATRSFGMLLVGLMSIAILSARSAAGVSHDLGWWALAFLLLASGSLTVSVASLRTLRGSRRSLGPVAVAVVAAVLCVQAAIMASTGGSTWAPGVYVLPLISIALLAVGFPLYQWAGTEREHDAAKAEVFEMLADSQVEGERDDLDALVPVEQTVPSVVSTPKPVELPKPLDMPAATPPPVVPAKTTSTFSQAVEADDPPDAPMSLPDAEFVKVPKPVPVPMAEQVPAEVPVPVAEPDPVVAPAQVPKPVRVPAAAPVAAAAERPAVAAVSAETEDLPAHFVDPTTGLLSIAGLQAQLTESFALPRAAGEVSILMIAFRNLDTIEQEHGRVASARTIAELARRLREHMPEAHMARFATHAFCALIDRSQYDTQALIERCASVLSELLEPVQVGEKNLDVDVAASMAQCYADEEIASFVDRANVGLERAVAADGPSLVAMP